MQAADLALPRGGGPGEGQKKPLADGQGFGSRLLEPVVCLEGYFCWLGFPRFCSEELPFSRHRLFQPAGSSWSRIQQSAHGGF